MACGDLGAGQSDTFSNGKPASSELGQATLTSTAGNNRGGTAAANTLSGPASVAVDPVSGKVFVADTENHRVLRYASTAALANGAAAERVIGQPNFTITAAATTASRFSDPKSICCDGNGRLWVLDDDRVLRFDGAANLGDGPNANGVLGQENFTDMISQSDQDGLGDPTAIFVSVTGALWVSSGNLNRISRFASAAGKANGADADSVLGQANFMDSTAATTRSGLSAPAGVSVDQAGNLYVADSGNHRVLVFEDAETLASGSPADIVLGQAVDTTAIPDDGAIGMDTPVGVSVSPSGTLYVADQGNDRVLLFLNASTKGDGGAANGVLGKDGLESQTLLGTDRSFVEVSGLWADGNRRLWAADPARARVMRFDTDRFQPDAQIGLTAKSLRGNDRYNATGAGQEVKLNIRGTTTGKAVIRIDNDGDVSDGHRLAATKGIRFIRLQYFLSPGGNATAAITAGQLTLPNVAAGAPTSLELRATGVRAYASRVTNLKTRLLATSSTDASVDRVNCTVAKRP